MRLTRQVFLDLLIWMIGFGLLIGCAFPFFVMLLGVPAQTALTRSFFAACLSAGALAGTINFLLARVVVGRRVRLLAESMTEVGDTLQEITFGGDAEHCTPEKCSIVVDSDDELGDSARAFNRLIEALALSMSTQAAVRSFSEMLTSELELEAIADPALRQLMDGTGAAGGALLADSAGELRVLTSFGLRDAEDVADSDHVRAALRTGETQTFDIPEDVRVEGALTDFRPREVLVMPITYKRVPLGVVVLASASPFDASSRSRLDLFRHGLGLALNNALAHDRLQRLAALDPLTGVYNRRFGLGRLREEFGRAVRAGSPVGLIMLDIDHFKSVNDTYGHLVGDRLLTSIAVTVKSILRDGDVLIRYGGEEFLALLPAASADDLEMIGERIRRAVEDSSLADGSRTVRVTVSLGAAAYPHQSVESSEALLELADQALYSAKEAGRNRVEIAH